MNPTMPTGEMTMPTGEMLIGREWLRGGHGELRAVDPASGDELEPAFGLGGSAEVDRAATLAADAFDEYRSLPLQRRAEFLERIADEIDADSDAIVARAGQETRLPEARLLTERGRTTQQLRLFAALVREGSHLGVRIDPAQPDRSPLPRPDLRLRRIPIGPVAVFGSSNFPLAFSNAGGDTAAALAAGCPVVVKVHAAHLGTAMLVSAAVLRAAEATGMPAGVYSALIGSGRTLGQELVAHPAIAAVGFTGSRAAGTALMQVAAGRAVPIPVHAEMSSINPVYVFDSALDESTAQGLVGSLTMGSGQFCTNPGLVFVPRGERGDTFVSAVAQAVGEATGQTMLTSGICDSFEAERSTLAGLPGVEQVASGRTGPTANAPAPSVLSVGIEDFLTESQLQAEMFGATSLIVRHDGLDQVLAATEALEGQLTATIRISAEADQTERTAAATLLPLLERRVGRILVNGWPTGVEVTHAMVHGGPWPATSDGRTTSVGTLAIDRFLRPVSYQELPQWLLPTELHDENPWQLVRRVDGTVQTPGDR